LFEHVGYLMNILFLIADDLNDSIGCYRGISKTPHIDRFAASAVRFDNVSCPVALCNPSRSAMLTGLAPWKSGVYNNQQCFREFPELKDIVTLPPIF